MFIYTDNSKENVFLSGLKTLGYDPNDFKFIVDMFGCDGGATKKTTKGVNAFKEIMKSYCEKNNIDYNLSNFVFYDDNLRICEFMELNGIQSFHVLSTEIRQVGTQNAKETITNTTTTLMTQPADPIPLEPMSFGIFSIYSIIILLLYLIGCIAI